MGDTRADLRCARCGETEALRGERSDGAIAITCEKCGHSWRREPGPACPKCGRTDLIATAEPLVERVRGTQMAQMGKRTVYRCPDCDA